MELLNCEGGAGDSLQFGVSSIYNSGDLMNLNIKISGKSYVNSIVTIIV